MTQRTCAAAPPGNYMPVHGPGPHCAPWPGAAAARGTQADPLADPRKGKGAYSVHTCTNGCTTALRNDSHRP